MKSGRQLEASCWWPEILVTVAAEHLAFTYGEALYEHLWPEILKSIYFFQAQLGEF
jgi:hypothetical protein